MPASRFRQVAPGVLVFPDTCNVGVLLGPADVADADQPGEPAEPGNGGGEAVLVDFGSGDVLDHLAEIGVTRVTDVLMTHHHRDQGQGLARAAAAGIRIWVPPVERELFDDVEAMWAATPLAGNYELREDRFSLLESVPVHATVPEYLTRRFGRVDIRTVPTPGHTVGSVSYLLDAGGRRIAFTGDLVHAGGHAWSMAALQWSYSGGLEGAVASVLSMRLLGDERPTVVVPSHGEIVDDVERTFGDYERRLLALINLRRARPWDLQAWLEKPFTALTPHLLYNRTSLANSYVLVSKTGEALVIDFGYDMTTGHISSHTTPRSGRRPWLPSLRSLRRDHGVHRIAVAIPTHYHDDHVAGMPLLQSLEGTEIWAEERIADILAHPDDVDLPAQWYDPIRIDRRLRTGEDIAWNEYRLTLHPLPGHTEFAVAVEFEVDGTKVLATGDQQDGEWIPNVQAEFLNFQYKNHFDPTAYVRSAELYRRLGTQLLITGHWPARLVDDAYLDMLLEKGRDLADLHDQLLPASVRAQVPAVEMRPRRVHVRAGDPPIDLSVAVTPGAGRHRVEVELVLPDGWASAPPLAVAAGATGQAEFSFSVTPAASPARGATVRRIPIAADIRVDGVRLGQRSEVLVIVHPPPPAGPTPGPTVGPIA